MQIEIEQLQGGVLVFEVNLAMEEIDVLDYEPGCKGAAARDGLQQIFVEQQDRFFNGDVDRFLSAEKRGEGNGDGDVGERDQIFVLDRQVFDIRDFQAQGKYGKLQVTELDPMLAAGDDTAEDVILCRKKKSATA